VFLVVCTTFDRSNGVQSWPKTMHWKDLLNTDKMTTISCKMDQYYNISGHFNFGPKMADPCGAWPQNCITKVLRRDHQDSRKHCNCHDLRWKVGTRGYSLTPFGAQGVKFPSFSDKKSVTALAGCVGAACEWGD
jgi:hypothetical protein